MYRIHFTADDLARTRVAAAPLPLMELGLAARSLRDRGPSVRLDPWRAAVPRLPAAARMALSLFPSAGYSPGFLTPPRPGPAEQVLEQVRATPVADIRDELGVIAGYQPLPAWARLLDGDADLRERLYDGLGRLFDLLLRPYWERITGAFTADRTRRTQQFLEGGVENVLTQANPQWMRWSPPVLEIRMANGIDRDLRLGGRGILLVPSLFLTRTLVYEDETLPAISYPAAQDQPLHRLMMLTPADRDALSALVGATRAAVLAAIAERPGCTTKQLAALTHIAPPSASEHASVLRQAGLIHTTRHRNTALHKATPLGVSLLDRPAAGLTSA